MTNRGRSGLAGLRHNPGMKITLFPALLLGLGLMSGCGRETPPTEAPDIRPVRAEQMAAQGSVQSARYSGEVRARVETDLAFRVGGRVASRQVEVGSVVMPGQTLATLDATDYTLAARAAAAQLEAAEAEARLARDDLTRYTELRARNFIAEAELERRRTASDAAQSKVQALRADASRQGNQADYTRLTAPHGGVVTTVQFEAGQVVAAGQPVLRLARAGIREVKIDVPENALDALRSAKVLNVRLWSVPDKVYAGRLRELAPMADPATRTYAARISMDAPDAKVKLGMTATVDVASAAVSALSVPLSALFKVNGHPQVWVVDVKSGKVAARTVGIGALNGERARVTGGLAPGDWVVTAGVHKLAPGQRVRLVR